MYRQKMCYFGLGYGINSRKPITVAGPFGFVNMVEQNWTILHRVPEEAWKELKEGEVHTGTCRGMNVQSV